MHFLESMIWCGKATAVELVHHPVQAAKSQVSGACRTVHAVLYVKRHHASGRIAAWRPYVIPQCCISAFRRLHFHL